MKNGKIVLLLLCLTTLLWACKSERDKKIDEITSLEKKLTDTTQMHTNAAGYHADTTTIKNLLAAYEQFGTTYPTDSLAPVYLIKASQFYRAMNRHLREIEMYNLLYTKCTNSNQREYALFAQGYIFENDIKNYEGAKSKYNEFIKAYPKSPLAQQAAIALLNMGKSPEQLYNELMAKQPTDSTAVVE
jgi:tetratricopeptide (TPR) repeat protein